MKFKDKFPTYKKMYDDLSQLEDYPTRKKFMEWFLGKYYKRGNKISCKILLRLLFFQGDWQNSSQEAQISELTQQKSEAKQEG